MAPVEYLDLFQPNTHGKVILDLLKSEILVPVSNSDIPFIIKVEIVPNTTCWPSKCMIIMTLSMEDKEKWSKSKKRYLNMKKYIYFFCNLFYF